ncbi:MAG: hypothetical protein ABJG78_04645 [Cyclobacteriaceae bacterium]
MKKTFRFHLESLYGKIRNSKPEISTFSAKDPDEGLDQKLKNLNANQPTELCAIMKDQNSDKGIARHNYTTVYNALFSDLRNKELEFFELGIGTNNTKKVSNMGEKGTPGASLRGWSTYFPNSKIYGADIDKDILFSTEKINTYYCDQTDQAAIKNMWNEIGDSKEFDIIIEDGLHTYDANISFFEPSIEKISKTGYYIIEDVELKEFPRWVEIIESNYIKKYPHLVFVMIKLPVRPLESNTDNNLIVVYHAR